MAISSMTGFARADGAWQDCVWNWELKTVNSRGLDVRLRMPNGTDAIEPTIRAAIAEKLSRGAFNGILQLMRTSRPQTLAINEELLEQVIAIAQKAGASHGLEPARIEGLLGLKGVLEVVDAPEDKTETGERNAAILNSFGEAVDALVAARQAEGARMESVLADQLSELGRLLGEANNAAARQPEAIRERLQSQLDDLLAGRAQAPDPERIAQEVAMLVIKADVREELDRLGAHIEAGTALLSAERPVGRELDFLAQEFGREANTLCSKANEPGLSTIGLAMKTVIDQMREQIQNIE